MIGASNKTAQCTWEHERRFGPLSWWELILGRPQPNIYLIHGVLTVQISQYTRDEIVCVWLQIPHRWPRVKSWINTENPSPGLYWRRERSSGSFIHHRPTSFLASSPSTYFQQDIIGARITRRLDSRNSPFHMLLGDTQILKIQSYHREIQDWSDQLPTISQHSQTNTHCLWHTHQYQV